MADLALFVNGRDVSDFRYRVARFTGSLGTGTREGETLPLLGRAGEARGTPARWVGRDFVVEGWVQSASPAALVVDLRGLTALMSRGLVELRTLHDSGIVFYGELRDQEITALAPQGVQAVALAKYTFRLLSPVAYAVVPDVLAGVANERVAIPVGSHDSAPDVYICGAATNPVLTLRSSAGDALLTVTFTITLAATDYLILQSHIARLRKCVSGVITDCDSIASTGNPYPVIQTAYTSANGLPTLETSAGSLVIHSRRTYLS